MINLVILKQLDYLCTRLFKKINEMPIKGIKDRKLHIFFYCKLKDYNER